MLQRIGGLPHLQELRVGTPFRNEQSSIFSSPLPDRIGLGFQLNSGLNALKDLGKGTRVLDIKGPEPFKEVDMEWIFT
jgi:hypothetical protein